MNAAHLVPELALARVVTAGGPYRPGDDLSLAFTTPTVSRLVAHDAELRAKCVPLERALVPETITVAITHAAAPYASGEVLTLSFVDPRVARIHDNRERQARSIGPSASDPVAVDVPEAPAAERTAQPFIEAHGGEAASADDRTTERRSSERALARTPQDEFQSAAFPQSEMPAVVSAPESPNASASAAAKLVPGTGSHSQRPLEPSDRGVSYSFDGELPAQIRAGERMTLRDNAVLMDGTGRDREALQRAELDASIHASVVGRDRDESATDSLPGRPPLRSYAPRNGRVTVRLEWKSDRLRRFVQVVDKLFTIDRLGWYRHSLAMRLLIPDEIACDDMLASVEAMRHLQALRAAAVESLGKPLLAACMPGFSITSEWLETLESSREARAIAGLREALLPFADDDEDSIETPSGDALSTNGTIARRELLPESATSVEAFLPLLIPTTARDAALGLRLAEYRRLLIELFAQTARAGEPVRLHQMAQPNHSLDDRLWQLVGAAAEAFGGFAHA